MDTLAVLGVILLMLAGLALIYLIMVVKRVRWEKNFYSRARESVAMLPENMADVAGGINNAFSNERRINLKIFFCVLGWILIIASATLGIYFLIPQATLFFARLS